MTTQRARITLTFDTDVAPGIVAAIITHKIGETAHALIAVEIHAYDLAEPSTWQAPISSDVLTREVLRADALIAKMTAEEMRALPATGVEGIHVLQRAANLARP